MPASEPEGLARVRSLAKLLDSSIRVPGTEHRFGIDALLGLVPGAGGAAGLALSTAVIVQAIRVGARGATVARMVLLVAVDAGVGSIPVLGTVFDFVFKANNRAVALLERHAVDPEATRAQSAIVIRRTIAATVVALLVIGGGILAGLAWLIGRVL